MAFVLDPSKAWAGATQIEFEVMMLTFLSRGGAPNSIPVLCFAGALTVIVIIPIIIVIIIVMTIVVIINNDSNQAFCRLALGLGSCQGRLRRMIALLPHPKPPLLSLSKYAPMMFGVASRIHSCCCGFHNVARLFQLPVLCLSHRG